MKIIDLNDRFARSLVAGLISSIVLFSLNMFSYYVIHFSKRRFINWASILIFGRKTTNIAEEIISSISQIGFATGLIILVSNFAIKERSKNYIWKGLLVGLASWFIISALSYMIGIEKILSIDANSAVSFMISSSIWGILSAWILHVLDSRYGMQTNTQLKSQSVADHII